jgi:hypothetical protein
MTDLSIRHQILVNLRDRFRALATLPPVDNPYGLSFSVVGLGPLVDFNNTKRRGVGVVGGKETVDHYTFPYQYMNMVVSTEFRALWDKGDPEPGELAEIVLTAVKRIVLADKTHGGFGIDTTFSTDEIDLSTFGDRTIMGVVHWDVKFRTLEDDPTQN